MIFFTGLCVNNTNTLLDNGQGCALSDTIKIMLLICHPISH